MEKSGKSELTSKVIFDTPPPTLDKFKFIPNKLPKHNAYPDCKNIWAPTAHNFQENLQRKVSFKAFVCFWLSLGAFISIVGTLLWTQSGDVDLARNEHYNVHIENVIPVYQEPKIEVTLINYASVGNNAEIDKESSIPEYHGILVLVNQTAFTPYNSLNSLIEDSLTMGHCWPIYSNYGFATVKLSHSVMPKYFTMIHRSVIRN